MTRHALTWGALVAIEPTPAEVAHHAPALAAAYNEPHTMTMLGHTQAFTAEDVVEHYASITGHNFLFLRDGALVADGDLRGLRGRTAELAFLVTAAHGHGVGTQVAHLLHVFGFRHLALDTIYASVRPDNPASLRVFEKLGHRLDDGATARSYADEPDDLVLAIDRETYLRSHAAALADVRITVRD